MIWTSISEQIFDPYKENNLLTILDPKKKKNTKRWTYGHLSKS